MRRYLAGLIAATALVAVPAAAQIPGDPVRVDPPTAGKPSHLILDVRVSEDPQAGGRTPQAAYFLTAAGGKFDPRARSERCSPERAKGFDCPGNSKIGSGTANGTATSGPFSQAIVIDIEMFLAPPPRSGDIAGVVVQFKERSTGQRGTTTGRVVKAGGAFGNEVRFEDLGAASGQAPEGVTVKIDRLQADVGASRKQTITVCCKTVRRDGRKKRVRYKKVVKRHLITNPRTCGGSWPYQVRLRYSSTDESVRDGTVACRSSR